MTRKIVQIAASESGEGGRSVFALCDDGALFCCCGSDTGWTYWHPLPPIPQPEPPARNPFNLPEAVLRGAIPG